MTNAPADRGKLYRSLYNAAMANIDANFRHDEEAVKALRDETCNIMFGKVYKDLTNKELTEAIHRLRVLADIEKPSAAKTTGTKSQLNMLRFYMMSYGFHYHDFGDYIYKDDESGVNYSGHELRLYLIKRWQEHKLIPRTVFYNIYKDTINPKSHRFLIEGNFKKFTKNAGRMNYEYLSPQEMSYLITRYKQIYSVLSTAFGAYEEKAISEMN